MVAFIRAPRGSLKPRRPTSDRSQALRCPTLHIAALRLRAQPSLDELAYRIPGFTSAPKWRDGAWPASISRNRRSKATSTRVCRSRNRAASPSSNNPHPRTARSGTGGRPRPPAARHVAGEGCGDRTRTPSSWTRPASTRCSPPRDCSSPSASAAVRLEICDTTGSPGRSFPSTPEVHWVGTEPNDHRALARRSRACDITRRASDG